ncbi:galactitol-1-phosphate 5-dehydrogenase [Bacillus sp. AFS055030]|nr:galactitol-1-phosphate 5-dehydrogenase [Bacillus sp. AFS055030]
MNAAVLYAPADLRYEQTEIPEIHGSEVLVNVKVAGVCGSDLGRVMKTGTYHFPTIPGHEFSGEVVAVGPDVTKVKTGDRVAVSPMHPCLKCEYCEQGDYGLCEDYNFLGSRTDGGFAEYVKVPEQNMVILSEGMTFHEGAMIEPAAVTLHGMKIVGINVGDTVVILGCGPLGLFALQFARIMGATTVIAVDISEEKLELAKSLGADQVVLASNDTVSNIKRLTDEKGAHVVIETAGVAQTQEQSLRIARKKGRVLFLGTAHHDVVLPPKSFECIVRNELSLHGSWNSYSAPFPGVEWNATVDYYKAGLLKMKPMITHVFNLSEAPTVFKDLINRKYPFTKVLFETN